MCGTGSKENDFGDLVPLISRFVVKLAVCYGHRDPYLTNLSSPFGGTQIRHSYQKLKYVSVDIF